jgi:hypothetical protein
VLVSGSIDGQVHLAHLENNQMKNKDSEKQQETLFKAQNC